MCDGDARRARRAMRAGWLGAASWLQLHAQIQARRAGCSCMRHAFDGGIFRVGVEGAFFGFGETLIRSTVVTGQTEGLRVGCGGMGVWVVITF